MKQLTDLPNIGKILVDKLEMIGIRNEQELKQILYSPFVCHEAVVFQQVEIMSKKLPVSMEWQS